MLSSYILSRIALRSISPQFELVICPSVSASTSLLATYIISTALYSKLYHCNRTVFLKCLLPAFFDTAFFLSLTFTLCSYVFIYLSFNFLSALLPPLTLPPLPCSVSMQGPYQRFLLKELLRDYNPMERPVANDSHSLTVQFSFTLMQVMDVVRLA